MWFRLLKYICQCRFSYTTSGNSIGLFGRRHTTSTHRYEWVKHADKLYDTMLDRRVHVCRNTGKGRNKISSLLRKLIKFTFLLIQICCTYYFLKIITNTFDTINLICYIFVLVWCRLFLWRRNKWRSCTWWWLLYSMYRRFLVDLRGTTIPSARDAMHKLCKHYWVFCRTSIMQTYLL